MLSDVNLVLLVPGASAQETVDEPRGEAPCSSSAGWTADVRLSERLGQAGHTHILS